MLVEDENEMPFVEEDKDTNISNNLVDNYVKDEELRGTNDTDEEYPTKLGGTTDQPFKHRMGSLDTNCFLRTHIQSFITLRQLLIFSKPNKRPPGGQRGVPPICWGLISFFESLNPV